MRSETSGQDRRVTALPRAAQLSDLVLAVLLAGLAAVLLKVLSARLELADWIFVPLVVLPLALRRSRPRTSAALVGGAALVQALLAVPIGFHDAAVLLALATLGGWTDRRTGLVGVAAALVLTAVGAWRQWWGYLNRRLGPDLPLAQTLSTAGAVVLVAAAWAFGEQARRAREGDLAVRQRAEQLERERSQLAELSAAAERTRIAREMHDVVAHGLTVMIVQADGASYALPPGAEASRPALLEIARTGRSALQEMRQLLGLLRAEDGPDAGDAPVAPAPGLRRLDDLVAEARTAGAEVTLETDGDLSDLSDLTSLTAYRVIQEGLTNARRHGGPVVTVTLRRRGEELLVQVQDSGRARSDAAGPPGVGLTGLRERVTATGGRTRVGPVEGGGFAVTAWMPVSAAGQDAKTGREGVR